MLSDRFLSSVGGTNQRLILLILNFRLPPVTFALWRHGMGYFSTPLYVKDIYNVLDSGLLHGKALSSDWQCDIAVQLK